MTSPRSASDYWPPGGLLDWVEDPQAGLGVHILREGAWELHDYGDLADRVRGASERLRDEGIRPADVVAIATPATVDFLVAFYATLYAGATPLTIAPLLTSDEGRLARILAAAQPALLIGDAPTGLSSVRAISVPQERNADLAAARPAETALLQFTSGTTGEPRGIPVTRAAFEAHLPMIAWELLDTNREDAVASWLPLHHDMGLIGNLVVSVWGQVDLWHMQPHEFLLDPVRWLECFGRHGATITTAPNFGYGYVARRVRPEQLDGLDFSDWRIAVAGAERLVAADLAAFTELLEPFGLRPDVLRPAYGLAEATLAVSGTRTGTVPRMVRLDWDALQPGGSVGVEQDLPLGTEAPRGSPSWLISCGTPLQGVKVTICDESGGSLPEGVLGEIAINGDTVAEGYVGAQGGAARFADGRLYTADAGFLLDGELFVVGRMSESLKVRGRHVYVEDLEAEIAASLRMSVIRCVAIPAPGESGDAIAVVLEAMPAERADEALAVVRSRVGPSVAVRVYTVEAYEIPRTTSGKPRRRLLWEQLLAGTVTGAELRARHEPVQPLSEDLAARSS